MKSSNLPLCNVAFPPPSPSHSFVNQYGKKLMKLHIKGGPRRVAFLFGEHSRELISAESALRTVKYLCGVDTTDAIRARVKQALSKYNFLIFPNVNPEGRVIVEGGRYCHRTNARHVDLNRNWASHWKSGGLRETAPGPSAFSEGETKLVRDVVQAFRPDVFMSVHSGALGMYTPYAYKKSHAVIHHDKSIVSFLEAGKSKMIQVLREVNKDYCRCGVGAAALELNYLCPGNCMDYVFDEMRVPYSFAFEIWDGKTYANDKVANLLEANTAEEMLERLDQESEHDHNHNHNHDHDHNHEHTEAETEAETETDADMNDSFVQVGETVVQSKSQKSKKSHKHGMDASMVAPKPQRGHSCFTMHDDFAPTAELEGFLEIQSEVGAESAPRVFPPPVDMQHKQCLRQFNPLTPQEYEKTVDHWSNAFLVILNKLPNPNSL